LKEYFDKLIKENSQIQSFFKHFIYLSEVDSTNTFAKNLTEKEHGICIYSSNQRFGKGRNNRTWFSKRDDSLAMSMVLEYIDHKQSSLIPIATSIAVNKTLDKWGIKSKIKWPNDILVNSRKISGILCELDYLPNNKNFIIVGLGININNSEADFVSDNRIDYKISPTSMMMEIGEKIDIRNFIKDLLNQLVITYTDLKSRQFDALINYYKDHWHDMDKKIQVSLGNKLVEGIAKDIKKDGSLVLEIDSGIKEILAGEIISS
jgi:BirA family biotin operon repressor/biotin-[acetyl-CoA-carboxylase] ligase|tara:strand:- start:3010 stop:3795 length:786 start_codon:yes stop_codon:yes gene_type:complete